ncbi:hypothetical protein HUJ05_003364 [Dendroctonus ponderosae]|nr:hypothetical protein HUJ05_003364 [Dendroctonus ponderosae]
MGVCINGDTSHTLLFAYDQVIGSEDKNNASYMFRKLQESYEDWNLTRNIKNTKHTVVGAEGHDLKVGARQD